MGAHCSTGGDAAFAAQLRSRIVCRFFSDLIHDEDDSSNWFSWHVMSFQIYKMYNYGT